MSHYYVYIMANQSNSVLYTGVTNNLGRRVAEHINEVHKGFTKKYRVHRLVYYEQYSGALEAISREKQLKRWSREKKRKMIERKNPNWDDWSEGVIW